MFQMNSKKHLLSKLQIKKNILYLITLQMINVANNKYINTLVKMLSNLALMYIIFNSGI